MKKSIKPAFVKASAGKKENLQEPVDIRSTDGSGWLYSDIVKDHFFSPRNFMQYGEEEKFKFNGMGRVGSPACGDEMVLWIWVEESPSVKTPFGMSSGRMQGKSEKIKDCRWRTFGCGSAIASTSVLSEMIIEKGGMKLENALKIKPQDILERLGGLPDRKVHCSVLGDKALQAAINDYFRQTGQHGRIITAGAKVIDKVLNITDHDIEETVLEGAKTLEDVQKRLKVGIGDPEAIPQIEELIRFYNEKYYG